MTQSNSYADDYMKASEYLRLVLPFLSRHKLPASPLNYQIGYDFVSGTNGALKNALNELLEQPGEPTEMSLLNLYEKYISQDDKALESVREGLHKIIIDIKTGYDDSKGGLSDYLGSLNSFAEILAGSDDPGELAVEVQKVMENTRSTEESQRKFEPQMSTMAEEVEKWTQSVGQ